MRIGRQYGFTQRYTRGFTNGFTLVELLVVIGIIGLLLGILLPAMNRIRSESRSIKCKAQLRDIGLMYNMYLNENKQRVPRVNPLPSFLPALVNAPALTEVLEPYYRKGSVVIDPSIPSYKRGTDVFRCPDDRIINNSADTEAPTPEQISLTGGPFTTYFEREGSSYTYNVFFNAFAAVDEKTGINKTWIDAINDVQRVRNTTADRVQLLSDFDPFHDKPGSVRSRNYLYADFSVDVRRNRNN